METAKIGGITCHIIINRTDFPTIYWGEMNNCSETVEKVLALCNDAKCNYIVYEVKDWNADFSPWEFTLNKKMSFLGSGYQTLDWLINDCVPHCETRYNLTGNRLLCGYSLAGLFSLWTFYESQAFDGVISCSGSLWFGDCTRRQYELVCGDINVSRHILEWNNGGHFNEPEKRIAKGIKWITNDTLYDKADDATLH